VPHQLHRVAVFVLEILGDARRAVGTAVVAIRADHQIPRPTLVLTVNG